jgi:4-amino-4-deoxy-L-arabinose transferase-like glycosyltransferase
MKLRNPLFLLIALVLLARLLTLPILPLMDPTEGRYAVVSQQMATTHDWVTPKVWIEGKLVPFLGKPPLFFWLAAGSMKIFGINEFAARLPSWFAMLATLLLMGYILRRYVDERTSWLAVGMTASCPVFLGLGGAVATDMLLTFFVSGSVLTYLAFALETDARVRHRWSLLLFVLLAAGFMTKGPVALALFGLPVLAWTIRYRKWRLLRHHAWGWGIALFLAFVVPWFWICEARNPGFLKYFFVNENFLRFVTRNYGDRYGDGHVYPRGSALFMLLVATAPWSIYAAWAWWRQRRESSWRRRDELVGMLFLGFLVPTLFWCLARQLLLTYLVPMVPLFCAWLAVLLPRSSLLCRRPVKVLAATLATIAVAGSVAGVLVARERSAKQIVVRGRLLTGSTLVFSRRVPYSGYFYGGEAVLAHPKWTAAATAERVLAMGSGTLMVIKRKDVEDVPAATREHLETVATQGAYVLLAGREQPEPSAAEVEPPAPPAIK